MRRAPWSALVLMAVAPLAALAQAPAGPEFRVNTYTTAEQFNAGVAEAASGGFVIVWESNGQDGSNIGVFGQRYDSRGVAAGGEFQVNTFTTGNQGFFPPLGLGMDRKGGFVVTWPSDFDQDGSFYGVFGQRFAASGARAGGEFLVNSYTLGLQGGYGAAMGGNGHFVVTWIDPREGSAYGIFARRFDPAGVAQGADFLVNTLTIGQQSRPDVAVGTDGRFVIVWQTATAGGPDVAARRFDATGAALGAEFQVNTYVTGGQYYPTVEMARDGSFIVAWEGIDSNGSGIFARRYDAGGSALGAEFRAADPGAYAFLPSLAFDDIGRFVVTWTSLPSDGYGYGVRARRFDEDAQARGAEFQVNTYTTGLQYRSNVASDAVGNFTVSWVSVNDGSIRGIEAQRFGGLQPAALSVADIGGNGVLEVGDAFSLVTSWRNVNGTAQTFSGASSNLAAPPGLLLSISPTATYGPVADGAVAPCTPMCFGGTLTGTRPAGHQDAFFDEDITPAAQGQKKRWTLHVGDSFADVTRGNGFYRFVETLLHNGVTGGCGGANYCPGTATTREQMAVFVLVAKEGAGYAPPPCTTPVFNDVPAASGFCRFIEELSRRGVVSGCGNDNYCPNDPVTREQMSIFTLRTLDPALDPPACGTPVFNDVPASSPFCRWIEELFRRGVVSGCGNGNYCPTQPVTREQMGVLISATFALTLYGP